MAPVADLATLVGPAATGALRDAGAGWGTPWTMLAAAALAGALIAALIREPPDRGAAPGPGT